MSPREHDEGLDVDLFGEPIPAPDPSQATRGRRGAITAAQWQAWLSDEVLVARYLANICWRAGSCAYWLSTISSTGHGKLRVGSRTDDSRRVLGAHLFGYQLHHGVLADDLGDVVIGHRCDEPSCQQPAHMEVISRAENDADYRARRHQWPLSDLRGAHGRAVALRDTIRSTLDTGGDVESALDACNALGRPPRNTDVLF